MALTAFTLCIHICSKSERRILLARAITPGYLYAVSVELLCEKEEAYRVHWVHVQLRLHPRRSSYIDLSAAENSLPAKASVSYDKICYRVGVIQGNS